MDINIYKNFELKTKNTLAIDSKGIFITDENLIGGINYTDSVNNGEDFSIGSACCSSIQFELNNLNLIIDKLSNEKVIWKTGILTSERTDKEIIKKINSELICMNDDLVFCNKNGLKIYDAKTFELIEFQDVPDKEIYSMFIVENIIYFGHNEAPYLTCYNIQGKILTRTSSPVLNDFQLHKINYYNQMAKSFYKKGNLLKEYDVQLYNLKPKELVEEVYEFTQMGIFNLEEPVKVNDTRIKVTGYDNMLLFDKIIDDFMEKINYPITVGELLKRLCSYVGVTCKTTTFLNDNFSIKKNFVANDIKARQILQYICEIGAKFGHMDSNGNLELTWYNEVDYTVNGEHYTDVEISEYETKKIDKLQIKVEENDIGVIVGTGENCYDIQNNPLLYAEEDQEIRGVANNIYNAIKDFNYTPYKISTFPNPLIKAGNIINITTSAGQTIKAIIMNRNLSLSSDSYEATGNQKRSANQTLHESITALRGASNVLFRSIEETRSTITSVEKGLQSQIAQNAEEISLRVTKTEYQDNNVAIGNRISQAESSITQNANQIALRVTQTEYDNNKQATDNRISQAESSITQQANEIALRVTYNDYNNNNNAISNRIASAESSIIQNANQIALKVSQTDYNGNTISSLINQTADAIKIQASKVELSGYTTFAALQGEGTTSINGANIQTGSISADRIKTNELVVGTNIAMGSNAYISWSNVTGTYNVASKSDIPSDSYITSISEDTIRTSYIYAQNLEVDSANIRGTIYADKVDAEDIVGGHISGSTLSTGGGVSIDSTGITFGYDSGEIYYGSGTFKFYSYGDCSFSSTRGDIYMEPYNAVRIDGDLRISGDFYINNKLVKPTALLKLIEKMEEEEE